MMIKGVQWQLDLSHFTFHSILILILFFPSDTNNLPVEFFLHSVHLVRGCIVIMIEPIIMLADDDEEQKEERMERKKERENERETKGTLLQT